MRSFSKVVSIGWMALTAGTLIALSTDIKDYDAPGNFITRFSLNTWAKSKCLKLVKDRYFVTDKHFLSASTHYNADSGQLDIYGSVAVRNGEGVLMPRHYFCTLDTRLYYLPKRVTLMR